MQRPGKVTILGINGHIGHHAAHAFVAAGWDVTGFGRSNRHAVAGVRFVAGDADSVEDMRHAIGDSEVVVNALNLAYDKWDKNRKEALIARTIEAMGTSGRTMLFPGNVYNYAASDRVMTADLQQRPHTLRGEIRVRCEDMLKAAAHRGDMQVIILRAGDFYAPDNKGDWFDQAILREAGKHRVAILGAPETGHAWAYLPDLGRAFEKLAWHRKEFGPFENFHFAGHFVSHGELIAAIRNAAPVPLTEVAFPWAALKLIGLVSPLMRELVRMRYLWDNPMELRDTRLDAILGPGFGTPFPDAIKATVAPFFADAKAAA